MRFAAHLQIDEVLLAPGQEWLAFMRGWHFVRVHEGLAYWIGELTALEVKPDELLVLSPVRSGALRSSQVGPARLNYFRICPELLSGLMTLTERQYLERAALKPQSAAQIYSVEHPAAVLFTQLCKGINSRGGTLGDSLLTRSRLLEVVARCFEWEARTRRRESGTMVRVSHRIQDLIGQLTEKELCELPPGALAEKCGCSAKHFSRMFQSFYGVSLRVRQTELRMVKARELLSETSLGLLEVAKAVGCRHLTYFNTLFKKQFGVTPGQFRRRKLRAQEMGREALQALEVEAQDRTG